MKSQTNDFRTKLITRTYRRTMNLLAIIALYYVVTTEAFVVNHSMISRPFTQLNLDNQIADMIDSELDRLQ